MASDFPTFAYQGNHILAFHDNTVIAEGTDFAKVAETAEEYFGTLRSTKEESKKEATRKTATHVATPNGTKGTIISRVAGLWGDEITVRLENGQLRSFATAATDDSLEYTAETAPPPSSYQEYFQQKFDDMGAGTDIPSLTARLNGLEALRHEVSHVISSVKSYAEQEKLHEIILAADAEQGEIKESLDHLISADIEAMAPYTPREMHAAEQAEFGRAKDDTWLSVVAAEIVAESEAQDFDKLLTEGPTKLVSDLDSAIVADTGLTREMAASHIVAKTAGFEGPEVEEYRNRFLAATEQARRQELTYRQENTRKVAAAKEADLADLPDDMLFWR
jgi:hypothetical protein